MNRFFKTILPVVLLAIVLSMSISTQAKTKKSQRTIYYIVCGSYSSLDKAIKQSEMMSEVVFYHVYKATVNGKAVYRLCCQCYYNESDAKKDLNGIFEGFKGDAWWIWPSKGIAKCVYRPLSPADGETRMPALKPLTQAITK